MTFEVSFSPRAELDATESVIYLRSRSPQAAKKWLRELKTLRKDLKILPSRFPRLSGSSLDGSSYHAALHYSHKVIFRIDEQAKSVTIVRVYHSARKPFESDADVEGISKNPQ